VTRDPLEVLHERRRVAEDVLVQALEDEARPALVPDLERGVDPSVAEGLDRDRAASEAARDLPEGVREGRVRRAHGPG
jgi:hypothetical protein